jgi:RHS repeat-associated protein
MDVLGGASYVTEYDYDPVGNTSWVKDNSGNQTAVGYDSRGFKMSMTDPDMGSWSYGYDSLGQLTSQTDAKGQITTLGYDALGRMTSRVEKLNASTTESSTSWYYDDATVGGPKAKGKLTKVVVAAGGYAGSTGYEEQYVYDSSYGDLADAKRRVENEWFWISQTYDSLGRLDVLKYPNSVSGSTSTSAGVDSERLQVKHNYNATGYLSSVSDVAAGTVYWTAVSNSAGGAILLENLGNGLSTVRTFDLASGRLDALATGPGGSGSIQNLEFTWDAAGNLKERRDVLANKREEFDYDGLYRLSQSRLYSAIIGGTVTTDNYTYDTIGNLTNKGGAAGAYTYSNYNYGTRTGCTDTVARPHAVYQVTVGAATRRYCYDANGNLTTQTISAGSGSTKYDSSTWWVANLAKRISQSSASTYSDFWYGAGRERIRQSAQKSATTTEDTLYVGGLYEKFTRTVSGTPSTEYVHYIRGGGQSIAVVKRISGTLQTRYLHRDHLGSVVALTDSTGAVVERYSYDPWGKRRDPVTWVTPAPGTFSFDPTYTDRGYTGHEHIDHMGLVNMNGRIYDPEIGKFLSADPTTQYPESTQGWNRYAYCGNNPMSFVDPTGYSFLEKAVVVVVAAVISYYCAPCRPYAQAFVQGYLSSGGDYRAGARSMAMTWVFGRFGVNANASGGASGIGQGGTSQNVISFGAAVGSEEGTTQSGWFFNYVRAVVKGSMASDATNRTNVADKVKVTPSETGSYMRLFRQWWDAGSHTVTTCGASCARVWDGDPNSPYAPVTHTRTNGELVEDVLNVAMTVGPVVSAAGVGVAARGVTEVTVATTKGARYANLAANIGAKEFQSNLIGNGYKIVRQTVGTNGPVTIMSNGTKTYTIYTATSTGELSAQLTNAAGEILSKIRLAGP